MLFRYQAFGVPLAVAVLAGCGGHRLVTHVVSGVTPFTAEGKLRPGLHVVRTAFGACGPGSDVLPNDVYRCGSQNVGYDPCWRDYRSTTAVVVCLLEPWSRGVFRLRLAADPARSRGSPDLNAEPWGIELVSGALCIALQGAHDTVTGKGSSPAIDYGCENKLSLVRGINRAEPLWTIRAARHVSHGRFPFKIVGRIAIRTAWFGGNDPRKRHR
jgi:hypothetical protein